MLRDLTLNEIKRLIELCERLPEPPEVSILTIPSEEADEAVRAMLRGPEGPERDLLDAISALNPRKLRELTALMLLGRNGGSYPDAMAQADQIGDNMVGYVIEKHLRLLEYVNLGLQRIQPVGTEARVAEERHSRFVDLNEGMVRSKGPRDS